MRRKILRAAVCLIAAAALLNGIASAVTRPAAYVDNEWNFVDQSIDPLRGIPEDASGTLAQIQRRGVLKVAIDPEASPTVWADPAKSGDDRYFGPDIQLARRIAERMGVELKLIPLEATQILPALTEEQCDLTISGVAYTPARALAYTLSKGYYTPAETDRVGLIVPTESDIRSLDDLAGRVLIARRSSLEETVGARHVKDYLEFRRASSSQAVYETVSQGRADAGLVLISTAETYLLNNPDCGLRLAEGISLQPDGQYLGYRVAACKGENQIIYFVNGVIDEIGKDGSYARWMEEGIGQAEAAGLTK